MSLIATSQKEVADTLGIGERTFHAWIKEGCPGESRNYVIRDIINWARKNKWELASGPVDDADLEQELLRKRIEKLERENVLSDFKIRERGATLVDVQIIESHQREMARRLRSAVEIVEKKHGPMSCDPIRSALDSIVSELDRGEFDLAE